MRSRPRRRPLGHRRLLPPAMTRLVAFSRAIELLSTLRSDSALGPAAARLRGKMISANMRLHKYSRVERSRPSTRRRLRQPGFSPLRPYQGSTYGQWDSVGDAVDQASEELEEMIEALEEMIEEMSDSIEDIIESVSDSIEEVGGRLDGDSMERLKSALRNFIEHMERQFQDLRGLTP